MNKNLLMKPASYNGIILLSITFSVSLHLFGQSPNYEWIKAIGGENYDIGNAIAVDPETSDVYTAGVFSRTVDFDPGSGVFNLTAVKGNDIFISKSNFSGHFIWALRIGGIFNDFAFSISVDASRNVYVTGQFGGTVDFDPGEGVFEITSAGSSDIYVLKIDAEGNFIWVKSMGGAGNDIVRSLAVDPGSGAVYIKGEFNETADFDPGIKAFNLTHSSSLNGVFISKLDASGNFVWARKLDVDPFGAGMGIAPYGGLGKSIIVDASGNIYTTGWFHGTVDLDPGEGVFTLTATGVNDVFILKLDTYGKFVWAKGMLGSSQGLGHSVAVDASGNVFTSGAFKGTVDFDPGARVYKRAAQGDYDIFISKLDSSGNFNWAKVFGGPGCDSGNSIVIDPNTEDIYTTGIFTGTAVFDPGKGKINLTSAGELDVFISKLDAFGNFAWAKAFGGIHIDYGYDIVFNGSGYIHVTGGFTGPYISFGSTILPNADSTGNHLDIFVAKLSAPSPASISENEERPIHTYPNPVKEELKIKFGDDEFSDVNINIFNLQGASVYANENKNISKELSIDISMLPAADYFIAIHRNGTRIVKQVVKVQD